MEEQDGFNVSSNDHGLEWSVSVEASACGEHLSKQLKKSQNTHIRFVIHYPMDYPMDPPFVRVVAPKFVPQTGHVLVGGGICHRMLSDKWLPASSMTSNMMSILATIDSGSPQIERRGFNDYNEATARQSYLRAKQTHQWA